MSKLQGISKRNRAAVYVDGFNLYYPIREMGEPFLHWCNLWRLSESLCKPNRLTLQKVVYCTALPTHDQREHNRHVTINAAQTACGVTVIKGHYIYDRELGKYSEKQSDINVALSVILDGIDDLYDWAFLVSADSDQAATAKVFSERFPEKHLVSVAPPNRQPPKKSLPFVKTALTLKKEQIEEAVLPAFVQTAAGGFIRRPDEYTPPVWWVHPDARPTKSSKGKSGNTKDGADETT